MEEVSKALKPCDLACWRSGLSCKKGKGREGSGEQKGKQATGWLARGFVSALRGQVMKLKERTSLKQNGVAISEGLIFMGFGVVEGKNGSVGGYFFLINP